jgi:hypothetical protein
LKTLLDKPRRSGKLTPLEDFEITAELRSTTSP